MEFQRQNLIPGLPDDLASDAVLPQISWWDFDPAATVSKGWRSAIQQQRRSMNQQNTTAAASRCRAPKLGVLHAISSSPRCFAISIQLQDGAWEQLPCIPWIGSAPMGARCVCSEGIVYVLGGRHPQTSEFMPDCFCIDLRSPIRSWSRLPPMATGRSDFAAAACGGRIYVAGGNCDGALATAAAEAFDIRRRMWERLPNMPVPRGACTAAVADGRLLVFGGYSCSDGGDDSCDGCDSTFFVDEEAASLKIGGRWWDRIDATRDMLMSCDIRAGMLTPSGRQLTPAPSDAWRVVNGKLRASGRAPAVGSPDCYFAALTAGELVLCKKGATCERFQCPFNAASFGTSCFIVDL